MALSVSPRDSSAATWLEVLGFYHLVSWETGYAKAVARPWATACHLAACSDEVAEECEHGRSMRLSPLFRQRWTQFIAFVERDHALVAEIDSVWRLGGDVSAASYVYERFLEFRQKLEGAKQVQQIQAHQERRQRRLDSAGADFGVSGEMKRADDSQYLEEIRTMRKVRQR